MRAMPGMPGMHAMRRRELVLGALAVLPAAAAWAQPIDYPKPGATLRYVVQIGRASCRERV